MHYTNFGDGNFEIGAALLVAEIVKEISDLLAGFAGKVAAAVDRDGTFLRVEADTGGDVIPVEGVLKGLHLLADDFFGDGVGGHAVLAERRAREGVKNDCLIRSKSTSRGVERSDTEGQGKWEEANAKLTQAKASHALFSLSFLSSLEKGTGSLLLGFVNFLHEDLLYKQPLRTATTTHGSSYI